MTSCYVTQTTLGSWFGLSPQSIGKLLAARGLKDRTAATQKSLLEGYARQAVTKEGFPFFTWNAERITKLIDEAIGESSSTPYIDTLVRQVGEALAEAEGHRAAGSGFVADLIAETAYEDVPPGLVGLVQSRLRVTAQP